MTPKPPIARAELRTFARFLAVGGSATALQYVLLVVFVGSMGLAPVGASSIAYVISTLYNYAASHAFTFRSRRSHRSALPRYVLVSTVGLGLNAAIVWLAHAGLQLHYLAAQVLATAVTLCWNYIAARRWAFSS